MIIRNALESELAALAQLWLDGWRDAHADIVPEELARLRTLKSFHDRLRAALADVRVAGAVGAPVGFTIVKGDELYQLYVASDARGTGLARALVHDALARMRAKGIETAWLACAIGNDRAARFYEKSGWRRAGIMTSQLQTPAGRFPLDVWRYELPLSS